MQEGEVYGVRVSGTSVPLFLFTSPLQRRQRKSRGDVEGVQLGDGAERNGTGTEEN
jgi:hypothetical protein